LSYAYLCGGTLISMVEGRQLYYVSEILESPMVCDYLNYGIRGLFSIIYGNKFNSCGSCFSYE